MTRDKTKKHEAGKRWRERNPNYNYEYHHANIEKRTVYNIQYQRDRKSSERLRAIQIFGNTCQMCGLQPQSLEDYLVMEFHHPDGNPKKEHTRTIILNILAGKTGDYQLLCANCHKIADYRDGTRGSWINHLTEDDIQ